MISKLHDTLGLSGRAPAWARKLKLPVVVILACAALGLPALRTPTHHVYHKAKLLRLPAETGGIIIGDPLVVELSDGTQVSIRSQLRIPTARPGSIICLQELRRGSGLERPLYRTAHSRRCGDGVTVTYYKLP